MKKQTIMLLVMIFSLTACQNKKARDFVLPKSLILVKNCETGKYAIRDSYQVTHVYGRYASNGIYYPDYDIVDSSINDFTGFLSNRLLFQEIEIHPLYQKSIGYSYQPKVFDDSVSAKAYAIKYLNRIRECYVEDSISEVNSIYNFKQKMSMIIALLLCIMFLINIGFMLNNLEKGKYYSACFNAFVLGFILSALIYSVSFRFLILNF